MRLSGCVGNLSRMSLRYLTRAQASREEPGPFGLQANLPEFKCNRGNLCE